MIGAHILDGAIVLFEDSKDVHNGDIVAALIEWRDNFEAFCGRARPAVVESRRSPLSQSDSRARIEDSSSHGSLLRKQERRERG